jgi:hypothetical protein
MKDTFPLAISLLSLPALDSAAFAWLDIFTCAPGGLCGSSNHARAANTRRLCVNVVNKPAAEMSRCRK